MKDEDNMAAAVETHFCIPKENQFLIAELYFQGEHWAELNTENGELQLVLFPRQAGTPWTIPFAKAQEALLASERELRRRSVFFDPIDSSPT